MLSNFYIKSFLIGFLILFTLTFVMNYDKNFITLLALVYGLIGGIIFLIFSLIHKLITSKYASNDQETMKIKHQKQITLQFPEFEVLNLIKNYIEDMNYKIIESKEKYISCKTSMNLKTFGTLLIFEITPIDAKITEVKITSRPYLPTTIIDFGDSLEKIKKVEEYLAKKIN